MRHMSDMITVPAGGTLVNFGCGPTVHCNISASAVFKNIICAEYTEANGKELEKWLANDKDKFDWSVFFKYVAVLEGKRCKMLLNSIVLPQYI